MRILKSDIAFVLNHLNTSLVFKTRELQAFSRICQWKQTAIGEYIHGGTKKTPIRFDLVYYAIMFL